jgi:hypothetical protein
MTGKPGFLVVVVPGIANVSVDFGGKPVSAECRQLSGVRKIYE